MPSAVTTRQDFELGHAPTVEALIILPEQFFSRRTHDARCETERRLMIAVLMRAVGDLRRYAASHDRRGRRLLGDAQAWFASDDSGWPYSFVSICHTLGLEVASVRRGLQDTHRIREPRSSGDDDTHWSCHRVDNWRPAITVLGASVRARIARKPARRRAPPFTSHST